MKAFIAILAFVATVSAEADPVLLYNSYGTAVYGGYAPFSTLYNGVALKSAPCVNAANIPTPCAGGYTHYAYAPSAAYLGANILGARLIKREAEAEAEPAIFYNALGAPAYAGAYALTTLSAYGLKAAPCVNVANIPQPCAAGYSYYSALPAIAAPAVVSKTVVSAPVVAAASPAVISIAKREAEADPVLLYNNYGTPVYGAYAPFSTLYNGVALKSAPCVNAANIPTPCAGGYTHYAYAPSTAYLGANILGARLIKREAEAEAEPAIFYNALGAPAYAGAYALTTLSAYGLKAAPCVNAANIPQPCAAGYSYYSALPAIAAPAIAAPAVVAKTAVVSAPITTQAVVTKSVVSAPVLKSVVTSPVLSLAKREAEAEADPAYFYSGLPLAGVYGANVYGAYAGLPYAAGLVHTSRLGVCLNYVGQQVPC